MLYTVQNKNLSDPLSWNTLHAIRTVVCLNCHAILAYLLLNAMHREKHKSQRSPFLEYTACNTDSSLFELSK